MQVWYRVILALLAAAALLGGADVPLQLSLLLLLLLLRIASSYSTGRYF